MGLAGSEFQQVAPPMNVADRVQALAVRCTCLTGDLDRCGRANLDFNSLRRAAKTLSDSRAQRRRRAGQISDPLEERLPGFLRRFRHGPCPLTFLYIHFTAKTNAFKSLGAAARRKSFPSGTRPPNSCASYRRQGLPAGRKANASRARRPPTRGQARRGSQPAG